MSKQTKNSFMYIEDNGGGLHLFVFDVNDKVVGGITNLEYAGEGEWDAVKDSMSIDALEEIRVGCKDVLETVDRSEERVDQAVDHNQAFVTFRTPHQTLTTHWRGVESE